MLIFIEPESEKPIYQQIRDQIVEGIARGELLPGTGLPSIRQLAADFGINLHTVNKAYELLERQGFLQVRRKTGAVVQPSGRLAEDWEARLSTLLAEALAQGLPAEEIVGRCQRVLAALTDRERPSGSCAQQAGERGEKPDKP